MAQARPTKPRLNLRQSGVAQRQRSRTAGANRSRNPVQGLKEMLIRVERQTTRPKKRRRNRRRKRRRLTTKTSILPNTPFRLVGALTSQHIRVIDASDIGTIERGYIYFFYRPKVELENVHSIDEVQRFHMLLVPRPPEFSVHTSGRKDSDTDEMQLISEGADAVPAPQTANESKKKFRLIPIGKKSLPDPEASGGGKGGGRKQVFWATVATIGDDLKTLQDGLGEKTYETKTRGQCRGLSLDHREYHSPHGVRYPAPRASSTCRSRSVRHRQQRGQNTIFS